MIFFNNNIKFYNLILHYSINYKQFFSLRWVRIEILCKIWYQAYLYFLCSLCTKQWVSHFIPDRQNHRWIECFWALRQIRKQKIPGKKISNFFHSKFYKLILRSALKIQVFLDQIAARPIKITASGFCILNNTLIGTVRANNNSNQGI